MLNCVNEAAETLPFGVLNKSLHRVEDMLVGKLVNIEQTRLMKSINRGRFHLTFIY